MSRQTVSALLLVVAIVLLVLAIVTIVPAPHARMTSDLGYPTYCTFAPWSTLTLLFFGALAWVIRKHLKSLPE